MTASANAKSKAYSWSWQNIEAPTEQAGDRVPYEVLERTPRPDNPTAPADPAEPSVDAVTGLPLALTKAKSDVSTALAATTKSTPVTPERPEKPSASQNAQVPDPVQGAGNPLLPSVAADQPRTRVPQESEPEAQPSVAFVAESATTTPTAPENWDSILESWHQLLRQWAQDGSLAAAAQEAFNLDGPNAKPQSQGLLQSYISEWSSGNFQNLPQIVFLSAEDMPGAMGAYAISIGKIFINADWAENADPDAIHAVLTEEQGHHLDGVLNELDTPGDEGEILTLLLQGQAPAAIEWAMLRNQNDHTTVMLNGNQISVELSSIVSDGSGNDTITGSEGDDTIDGLSGNDSINGQAGNDLINGGDGDDTLIGSFGLDSLYGGSGNDNLTDNETDSLLDGGDGSDNLTARSLSASFTLIGGTGLDTLQATGLNLLLDGGDDNDTLRADGRLDPNNYQNPSYIQSGQATLLGGLGDDTIDTNYIQSLTIDGGDGNDTITGAGYISRPYLGYINFQNIYGPATFSPNGPGGAQQQTISGGAGSDFIGIQINWADQTYFSGSRPTIESDASAFIDGGDDNDSIEIINTAYIRSGGFKTFVTASGGSGDDTITITDSSAGNSGVPYPLYDNYLYFRTDGIASALISGGDGDDTITLNGVLQSTLSGGLGSDTFVLTRRQYNTILEGDRGITSYQEDSITGSYSQVIDLLITPEAQLITDFQVGPAGDVIDFSDLLANASIGYDGTNPFASGFLILQATSNGDTAVRFDADGTAGNANSPVTVAVLQGIDPSTLTADNFNPPYPPDGSIPPGLTLLGSIGPDTITGSIGDDTIDGLNGNDFINGDAGNDLINGGDGDDTLIGSFGLDSLYGGSGNDNLTDNETDSLLDGGDGSDNLTARSLSASFTLLGGAGLDNLQATGIDLLLDGGNDNDTLRADGRLDLNNYQNPNYIQSGQATLLGGLGDDTIDTSYIQSLTIDGGDGNDTITGAGYISRPYLGYINFQNIYGPATFSPNGPGGAQQQTISGGAGSDFIGIQINWADQTYFSGSRPTIESDASAFIDGGDDNDSIEIINTAYIRSGGFKTFVTASGGSGDDTITITDSSAGNSGVPYPLYDNYLYFRTDGIASALISGGDGDDTITLNGVLQSTLSGGLGSDTFVLTRRQYNTILEGDRGITSYQEDSITGSYSQVIDLLITPEAQLITDFQVGPAGDVIDFSDLLANASIGYDGTNPFASGFLILQATSNGDTAVRFDADGTAGNANSPVTVAVLQGIDPSTLTADNFNPPYPPDGSIPPGLTLLGSIGPDTITGSIGDDTIDGLNGNDFINGDAGNDLINGGDGDDTLIGSFGLDSLYGGSGNDNLTDNETDSLLDGGDGSDNLTARSLSASFTLIGGTGLDTLQATGLNLLLDGGDDNDTLRADGRLDPNNYQNPSYIQSGQATLLGGLGDDTIDTNYIQSLTIDGGDGNDTITGAGYISRPYLGYINFQNIYGPATFSPNGPGGAQQQTISGGAGSDFIGIQINWADQTYFSGSRPTIESDASAFIDGGDDNDSIKIINTAYIRSGGFKTFVTASGGSGDDTITITDSSAGNSGVPYPLYDNYLYFRTDGIASALISGGDGDDTITLNGVLQSTLSGGLGSDTFVLTRRQYNTILEGDRGITSYQEDSITGSYSQVIDLLITPEAQLITDFQVGPAGDVIDFSDLLANASIGYDGTNPFASGFLILQATSNGDTAVRFDADGTAGNANSPVTVAVLQGIDPSTLTADNFNPPYPPDGSIPPGELLIGTAIDGYLRLATVFLDLNGNLQQDGGEISTTTNGNGDFELSIDAANLSPEARLVLKGGFDISTGLVNINTYTAQIGSSVITPITSLIDKVSTATGSSLEAAALIVAQALGLPTGIDLSSYDPIAFLLDTNASAVQREEALAIQKVASQLANIGYAANDNQVDQEVVLQSLADQVVAASTNNSSVSLDDATLLQTILPAELVEAVATANAAIDAATSFKQITSNAVAPINEGAASFEWSGTPVGGNILSVLKTVDDPDGGILGTPSFQWESSSDGSNWEEIGTSESYELTDAEVGKQVRVLIQYIDGQLFDEPFQLDIGIISGINLGDATPGSITGNGTFQEGVTLNAGNVTGDPDGDGTITAYQWFFNNTAISGANTSSYNTSPTGFGTYKVALTYTDAQGFSATINSPEQAVAKINNANGTPSAITGNGTFREGVTLNAGSVTGDGAFQVGVTLTAGGVSGDPDGDGSVTAYQWFKNDSAIANATTATHNTTATGVGNYKVALTYTDGQDFSATVESAAVDVITGRRTIALSPGAQATSVNGIIERFEIGSGGTISAPPSISNFNPLEDFLQISEEISERATQKTLFTIRPVERPEGPLTKSQEKSLKAQQKAQSKALKNLAQGKLTDSFAYSQLNGQLFFDASGKKKGFGEGGGLLAVLEDTPAIGINSLEFL